MPMTAAEIIRQVEKLAPRRLAEDWDNAGLMLGDVNKLVERIMVSLDVTAPVVKEAVDAGADMIITHHPLIFRGLKNIDYNDSRGRNIINLVKNDICVYSAHTNLDTADGGLNDFLAEKLGLKQVENLFRYKREKLYKLAVYVPVEHTEKVREAVCRAGAGHIGRYSDCSFAAEGTGTYMPLEGTNPYKGTTGRLEKARENKLETVVPESRIDRVINAMLKAHPYEEVAYDLYELHNAGKDYGIGKAGFLDSSVSSGDFLERIKKVLRTEKLRVVGSLPETVRRVAVFSGSFDERYLPTISRDIDILVTGDIKYHTALDILEAGLCVVDAGHFNTERIVVELLVGYLSERLTGVEVMASASERDPFLYY